MISGIESAFTWSHLTNDFPLNLKCDVTFGLLFPTPQVLVLQSFALYTTAATAYAKFITLWWPWMELQNEFTFKFELRREDRYSWIYDDVTWVWWHLHRALNLLFNCLFMLAPKAPQYCWEGKPLVSEIPFQCANNAGSGSIPWRHRSKMGHWCYPTHETVESRDNFVSCTPHTDKNKICL